MSIFLSLYQGWIDRSTARNLFTLNSAELQTLNAIINNHLLFQYYTGLFKLIHAISNACNLYIFRFLDFEYTHNTLN